MQSSNGQINPEFEFNSLKTPPFISSIYTMRCRNTNEFSRLISWGLKVADSDGNLFNLFFLPRAREGYINLRINLSFAPSNLVKSFTVAINTESTCLRDLHPGNWILKGRVVVANPGENERATSGALKCTFLDGWSANNFGNSTQKFFNSAVSDANRKIFFRSI